MKEWIKICRDFFKEDVLPYLPVVLLASILLTLLALMISMLYGHSH